MGKGLRILILLLPALLLSACSLFKKDGSAGALAVAYDKYLYRSELAGVVPAGTPANDSIEIVRQFIDNWIRQQVLLHQAENNLSPEQTDFSRQLEIYRNSLIVYEYESELIRQKLDTLVNEQEIQQFYNSNPANFQLRENIVKVSYIKVPVASANAAPVKKARQLLSSERPADVEKLEELCQSSILSCRIDDDNWMLFNNLLRELPLDVYDQENFLRNRKYFETSDSLYIYMVRFNDYKIKESLSPLSFEVDNIRSIILNRRKLELVNRMQQEVFQKALENKEFEIF